MAINFPDSPNNGDSFTSNNKTWVFDGTVWNITSGTNSVADGAITTAKLASNAVHQTKLASNLSGITITTTANRGTDIASPFTGQTIFLTDVKRMQVWDGSAWMFMTVGVPDAPTSLGATPLSTTSVSISFTSGSLNGSIVTNYKYALSTNGGSTYSEYAALDPADITSPITISGLIGATTYHIKLKAVADFGDSVDSSAVSATTLTPPGAPTSLSATALSGESVSIAFTAGATGGSAFTNMEYALSTNSGASYGVYTAFSPADYTTPVVISGLTENTQYTIKLRHVTTAGAGPDSSAVTITTLIAINYLVIAGGGGGGLQVGGGGGAGGYRTNVSGATSGGGASAEAVLSISAATNYTVTVGSGGAGASNSAVSGATGGNSVFSNTTSLGGGGGGSHANNGVSTSGGSGGGGGGGNSNGTGGSAGTTSQGYAGGIGVVTNWSGGGGGGAGGNGANGTASLGGAGGIGVSSSITGSTVFRAGGGGGCSDSGNTGSAGGNGGGGSGRSNAAFGVQNGTANTGGGGGGVRDTGSPGTGGSGVVILRYSSAHTITLGAGLTGSTATDGSSKVTTITAGTGNASWT